MTDDRSTPPPEERAHEDAELGFPPEMADQLRTTMTTAVAEVHAPARMYDEVRARSRRRRWTTRGGRALTAAAVAAGIALTLQALDTSTIVVDADPADSPGEAEPAPVPSPAPLDPTVQVPFPAYELAADLDGLHLIQRGPDGRLVDGRTVLSRAALEDLVGPGRVQRLSVRPGSTPDDIQAVLEIRASASVGSVHRFVTITVADGGETVSAFTWEGEAQLAGEPIDLGTTWSPDGRSFAYNAFRVEDGEAVESGLVVVDVDDAGRPTVAGRAPAHPTGYLEWVDAGDDAFSLWVRPLNAGQLEATQWVRDADGSVELADPGSPFERAYLSPYGGGRTVWAVPTRHGIVEGIGDGLTVRLLPEAGVEVLSTVALPTEIGSAGSAQLSSMGDDPVVLVKHEDGLVVIAPTADGTLETMVLPFAPPSTWPWAADWVD